jgi:hypothetical protein
MVKDLLPIGSIIRLKGGKKRLMIYGIKQVDQGDEDKEYDYVGVCYPEGNMGLNTQYLFDNIDIEELYFRGYEDDERAEFMKKLDEYYSLNKG